MSNKTFSVLGYDRMREVAWQDEETGELLLDDYALKPDEAIEFARWILETFAEPGKDGG